MTKTLTLLLAGAATLTFGAGAALAGSPADAARQASEDTRAAGVDGRYAAPDAAREQSREVRIYRSSFNGDARILREGRRDGALADILQLRPEQRPALEAFLEATRPPRRDHDHTPRFERDGDGRTTLQRLEEMQARMAEQQAETGRRIAAVKTFYGQLDDKQKKAFDALPMLMVVGPTIGPMMIPRPMPMAMRMHGSEAPPRIPAIPPLPPIPPRS